MAKARRNIAIHCSSCRNLLLRYGKGGTGGLVKCFLDRIIDDRTEAEGVCPNCQQQFARAWATAGKPALKLIAGKVFVRGMTRK